MGNNIDQLKSVPASVGLFPSSLERGSQSADERRQVDLFILDCNRHAWNVMAAYQGEQNFRFSLRPVYPYYFDRLIFGKPFVTQRLSVAPVLS
jgi:hypothetical protein